MTIIIGIALINQITVGQKYGVFFIGHYRCSEFAHDIRAIKIIGNLTETFRFTLGAVHSARAIQTFQRGVRFGFNFGNAKQFEFGGRIKYREAFFTKLVLSIRKNSSIECNRN